MMRVLTATVLAAAALVVVTPPPANAVVHEIYGAWCAGKGEIEPPGVSDATKRNFGQPVIAGGVVAFTPYLDGILIDFDFEKAQAKVVAAPTGPAIVQIGPGLYLERFVLDPEFAGFLHCANLEGLAG